MPVCEHTRTEFMMRRDGVDYLRCLDCDYVFEADDLESVPIDDDEAFGEGGNEPRRRRAS